MDKEIKDKAKKLARKSNSGFVSHILVAMLLMIVVLVLLSTCLTTMCSRLVTTDNLDKMVKGTHELVNHVDSVWQSENAADSIAMLDTVKTN